MISKIYKRIALTLLLPVIILMSFNTRPDDNLVIIVSSKNPIGTLTPSQAKDIYLRKASKRWKEMNVNIIPLDVRGESESKNTFLSKVLQMSKVEMYRYFAEREYQNQEQPPIRLYSDTDIIKFVQENSSAIGYVMNSSIADATGVKIICSVPIK